jgi:hypothetical protein
MVRRIGLKYIALNPGASYRGFHDSLVNYLGNDAPRMLLCLHEDHVISIAHGYAKVTDEPMGAVLHSNVGLMHGSMGIFNAASSLNRSRFTQPSGVGPAGEAGRAVGRLRYNVDTRARGFPD